MDVVSARKEGMHGVDKGAINTYSSYLYSEQNRSWKTSLGSNFSLVSCSFGSVRFLFMAMMS